MKTPINLTPSEIIVLVQHYESLAKTMMESAHNFSADVQAEFKQLCDEYAQRSSELREESLKEPEPNLTDKMVEYAEKLQKERDELRIALQACLPWIGKMIADKGHLNSVAPNACVAAMNLADAVLYGKTKTNWASGHNTPPCNAKP